MYNINDAPVPAHWFHIEVYERENRHKVVAYLSWNNMPFKIRQKYDWYFRYRAALLQVKYPKHIVNVTWGQQGATGKTAEHIFKDRVQGKKANITKYKNILIDAEEKWNSLYPIQEDPIYLKAVAKIERLENELNEFINKNNPT